MMLTQLRQENALSFMLFSYFGTANMNDHAGVVNAAIDRAYRDAASHVLSFENEEDKLNAKKAAKNAIADAVEALKQWQKSYDCWHKDICDKLMCIYKGFAYKEGYAFSVGIAQKWINMTMKYLYVLYYFCLAHGQEDSGFQLEYGQMISRYASDFHVPIDKVIINAAEKDFGITRPSTSWSKIDSYDEYKKFEDDIKSHDRFKQNDTIAVRYSPIDWEGPAWIKYAPKK